MPTASAEVLRRAREDIAAERLWKARDRLTGAVKARPTDQDILELLGEVHFAMGDLPSAGRFWLLTNRSGSEAEVAMGAFEERWGRNLGEKLKLVPFTGSLDDYPSAAQPRLRALLDQAAEADLDWPREPEEEEVSDRQGKIGPSDVALGAAILVLGPGLWLLGVAALIYLIAS